MKYRIFSLFYIAIVFVTQMAAENGSHLWLRLPANAHAEISAPRQSPTRSRSCIRHGKEPLSSSLYKGTNNCNQKVSASDMKITKSRSHLPPRQDYSMPPITCSGCKRPGKTSLQLKQQRIPPTACASSTIGTIWTVP